ncbi:MarR family transcriptional regulator [Sphaerisporangium album]|uniref:MarR family transcriptional regulator n=1 Tax=Sphaerisporangium album TaxID=509200 RepID=A0A367FTA8_9ACTN|nr:MarR family transcriptional regulator [Sphaerisporangium album]RCG33169.1 MarR family transcriptional regulator [Sphaerisporangium album]
MAPEDAGMRYLSVAYAVRKAVDDHMTAGGLSLARTKVLQVLDRAGPLSQAALASELGFAARSVSQAVEALEHEGLVKREPHPDDRRARLVLLTAEGSAALAAGTAAGERVLRQIFGGLDQKDLANLHGLLDSVEKSVAQAARTPPGSRPRGR